MLIEAIDGDRDLRILFRQKPLRQIFMKARRAVLDNKK